ncbi:MAG TPA: M14 family zinc carboxypeptidase [Gemmatimonadaceae bacterium]|nr:M14 family zinc carboxypeptidase [Gemmatimonadaceae bacterium]
MYKRAIGAFFAFLMTTVAASAQTGTAALDSLKTKPERTDFQETSTYQEVVDFMNAVANAAPNRVFLTTFGETNEKRALPLAVVGAPAATPEAVLKTGKLRVYIQGNIHGGEVEGKESAQMLLRELAQGKHEDWLKTMVFLIAPIYNADGNEKFALNNRGPQHGPMGGQGQRPNAQRLDLNRDHMKLDSPEARAVVKLMTDYDPHVSMDLHTTNGSRHAYFLTYAPPLNPATDPAIIDLLRKDWLPWVTKTIKSKYDWDYYYYGNTGGGGGGRGRGGAAGAPAQPAERAWRSFDSRPRFNNNYIGLRNRFAVLSEAFAYASFKDRILATSRFVEENLNYVAANAARIRKIVEAADAKQIIGTQLALRAQLARGDEVEILMGETTQEKHPVDGHTMELRKDVRNPVKMIEYGTFEATETERVPSTYYIPADLTVAIDHLRAHGVRTRTLEKPTRVTVEEFQITGNTQAQRAFEGHNERTLEGKWAPAERELPAGTVVVDIKQPLGRLAFYLIEPRSDDGLVDWNILDPVLGEGVKVYPIVRSRN